jgi:protein PhnA
MRRLEDGGLRCASPPYDPQFISPLHRRPRKFPAGPGQVWTFPKFGRHRAEKRIADAFRHSGQHYMDVKDSNGNTLNEGDSVQLIKDLKVKGTSVTLKRGTIVKNIRLTGNEGEIEGRVEKVKGLVLKTEFLKKV